MANADDLEVSLITESAKETSVSTAKSKPEGRWAEVGVKCCDEWI